MMGTDFLSDIFLDLMRGRQINVELESVHYREVNRNLLWTDEVDAALKSMPRANDRLVVRRAWGDIRYNDGSGVN